MLELRQELMTPPEAAEWFRRSASWLRHQPELLRIQGVGGQPLYHVNVCRAYVLGRLCGLAGRPLRRLQLRALVVACSLTRAHTRSATLSGQRQLRDRIERLAIPSLEQEETL